MLPHMTTMCSGPPAPAAVTIAGQLNARKVVMANRTLSRYVQERQIWVGQPVDVGSEDHRVDNVLATARLLVLTARRRMHPSLVRRILRCRREVGRN